MTRNNNRISIIAVSKQAYKDLFQNIVHLIGISGPFIALLTILIGYYTYTLFNITSAGEKVPFLSFSFISLIALFLITVVYGCKACCDWVSYFANKEALLDGYNPFKISLNNWGFLLNAIVLQISVIFLTVFLMAAVAGFLFFIASTFNVSANIGLMRLNVTGSNTPVVYGILGLMGTLLILIYAVIIRFTLNRIFKLPASALGFALSTDASKLMAVGYKLKLFITMLIAWVIPVAIISAGHSYLFDALNGITKIEWLWAFIFSVKNISYALLYVFISFAVLMIILKDFFKHAYENNSDKLDSFD